MANFEMLAYSPAQAAEVIGVCKTQIYALIKQGRLKARKEGRRTLILRKDLDAYLDSLSFITS